jgi:hypothetical protein
VLEAFRDAAADIIAAGSVLELTEKEAPGSELTLEVTL